MINEPLTTAQIERIQEYYILIARKHIQDGKGLNGDEQLGLATMYFNLELKKRGVFDK